MSADFDNVILNDHIYDKTGNDALSFEENLNSNLEDKNNVALYRKIKWTDGQIKLLLCYVQELSGKVGKSYQLITKRRMWEEITERFRNLGHERDVSQVESKYRSLERQYKKYRGLYELNGKVVKYKSSPYKKQMEKILKTYETSEDAENDSLDLTEELIEHNGNETGFLKTTTPEISDNKCKWLHCHVNILMSFLKKYDSEPGINFSSKLQMYQDIQARFNKMGYNFTARQIETKCATLRRKNNPTLTNNHCDSSDEGSDGENEEAIFKDFEKVDFTKQPTTFRNSKRIQSKAINTYETYENTKNDSPFEMVEEFTSNKLLDRHNKNDTLESITNFNNSTSFSAADPLTNRSFYDDDSDYLGKCKWTGNQVQLLLSLVEQNIHNFGEPHNIIARKKTWFEIKKRLNENENGCKFTVEQVASKFRTLKRQYRKGKTYGMDKYKCPFKNQLKRILKIQDSYDHKSNAKKSDSSPVEDVEFENQEEKDIEEIEEQVEEEEDAMDEDEEAMEEDIESNNSSVELTTPSKTAEQRSDKTQQKLDLITRNESQEDILARATLNELRTLRKVKEDWVGKSLEMQEKHYKLKENYYKDKRLFYDRKLRLLRDILEKLE